MNKYLIIALLALTASSQAQDIKELKKINKTNIKKCKKDPNWCKKNYKEVTRISRIVSDYWAKKAEELDNKGKWLSLIHI